MFKKSILNEQLQNNEKFEDLKKKNEDLKRKYQDLQSQIAKINSEIQKNKNTTVIQYCRQKISAKKRNAIALKQNNQCNKCKKSLESVFQIDHIHALQYGGADTLENMQALCYLCHTQKSAIENKNRNRILDAINNIIEEEMEKAREEEVI